jgi:hypothetical protein
MAANVVFLVHGIGRHFAAGQAGNAQQPTAGHNDPHGWSDAVIATLKQAWQAFPGLRDIDSQELIEFVPITYDHIFREYLAQIGDAAARVRQYMPSDDLNDVLGVLEGASPEEESFFWDYVTDLLDYQYGADRFRRVHAHIAHEIASKAQAVWAKHHDATFSVIAHSLGTAAAHGALNRLGGGNIGESAAFRLGGQFRLRSYTAIANVSRLLWYGAQDIYRSTIVRPFSVGQGRGYTDYFLNVRHFADPIPAPQSFVPIGWGSAYQSVDVRHLRQANVHALEHYLAHPAVSGNIFRALLGDAFLSAQELTQVCSGYHDIDLPDPNARIDAAKLVDQFGATLLKSYGADQALLVSLPKLLAGTVRDLYRHVSTLQTIMQMKAPTP